MLGRARQGMEGPADFGQGAARRERGVDWVGDSTRHTVGRQCGAARLGTKRRVVKRLYRAGSV